MTLLDLYRSCNHDKRLYYKLPNETFQLQNIVIDMLTFVKQSVMDSRHIPVSWPPFNSFSFATVHAKKIGFDHKAETHKQQA